MKLSVVIPCYNEEKNIPLLFEKFAQIINNNDIEVVFINNGSTDTSQEIFDELLPKHNFAKLVKVDVNQGYGYGIIQGLKEASGEYIGWTHADLQTDPFDIIKAKTIIDSYGKKDILLKGRRRKRPLFDSFFTFGMTVFELIYMGRLLNDINAQPTIFHRSFFESWQNPPHDFALDLYAFYLAKKNNIQIKRFDVLFPERIHGTSKWNTGFKSKIKFIKRTISFSKTLKKGGIK